jgi:uncharacterized membrane protein
LTGFSLFTVLYLWNAGTFLIDSPLHGLVTPAQAITAALGFLVVFWLIYDRDQPQPSASAKTANASWAPS